MATKLSYGYCLTINNPSFGYSVVEELYSHKVPVWYVVEGQEVSSFGTPHLQVCVYFEFPQSFQFVQRIFPKAHIEHLRKPLFRAVFYCMKSLKFFQLGNLTTAIDHDLTNNNYDSIIFDKKPPVVPVSPRGNESMIPKDHTPVISSSLLQPIWPDDEAIEYRHKNR